MNIFVLDTNTVACAQYHCDKHVVKMILETAQLMSTTNRYFGMDEGYKSTHVNHPCAKWLRESMENYLWLGDLAFELNEEYKYRFNHRKNHKSYDVICDLGFPELPDVPMTKRPQCMPDEYKKLDPVEAYRLYYIKEKASFCTWKNRLTPDWFKL